MKMLLRNKMPVFFAVYLLSILYNYHIVLVAYSNSTYMEGFTTEEIVGLLYSVSSFFSIIGFLLFTRAIKALGNVTTTLFLSVAGIMALTTLGFTTTPWVAITAFLVFHTISPILYLNLDIFSESLIGDDESSTGSKRGLILTLMSLASAIGPFTVAFLVGDNSSLLNKLYIVSASVCTLFAVLVFAFFRNFQDEAYQVVQPLSVLCCCWGTINLRLIFIIHFILQIFFAYTIVYFPLYMVAELGMSWEDVGIVIGIGLFAYVIFEYPAGVIADKYFGEKEMMVVGFAVLVTISLVMANTTSASLVLWAIIMFVSRFGAALAEVTTESYFFKQISGASSGTMSLFRVLRPLAMLVATLIGSTALFFFPFSTLFVILAALLFIGFLVTFLITDTQ